MILSVTQPTPAEYIMYLVVTIVSLLAGASVVHNIYKPDMVPLLSNITSAALVPALCFSASLTEPGMLWCASTL